MFDVEWPLAFRRVIEWVQSTFKFDILQLPVPIPVAPAYQISDTDNRCGTARG